MKQLVIKLICIQVRLLENLTKDEAKDITFEIKHRFCSLDILLEIQLSAGQRFTEKIFIPML